MISHIHELESPIRHFGPENLALIGKHTSEYIAVSDAVKRNLVENHAVPAKKIHLIKGFIPETLLETPRVINARRAIREELGVPLDSNLICTCGSLDHRKGPDLLLSVAENVRKIDLLNGIRREIRLSPLKDNVHFIGPRRPNMIRAATEYTVKTVEISLVNKIVTKLADIFRPEINRPDPLVRIQEV